MYLLSSFEVTGFLLIYFNTISLVEVDFAHIVLAYKLCSDRILATWHKSVAHFAHKIFCPIWDILVSGVRIVVVFSVALLLLDSVFVTKLKCVAIKTL